GLDRVSLGIDLDLRHDVVPKEVALADLAHVFDRRETLAQVKISEMAGAQPRIAHEGQARGILRPAMRGELRTVKGRLRSRDAGVRIAHIGAGDEAALED